VQTALLLEVTRFHSRPDASIHLSVAMSLIVVLDTAWVGLAGLPHPHRVRITQPKLAFAH
jgi:hypothetical protein